MKDRHTTSGLLIKTWALLRSRLLVLSPGDALFCVRPKPLTTPVTYTFSRGPKSKLVGFGLTARGPDMAGSNDGGAGGAAAGSAGLASPGFSSAAGGVCASPFTAKRSA